MGILEDVMKALERIPVWKRLTALPNEVEALQKRVAALEAKLGPKTGQPCPMCDERTMKVVSTEDHPEFAFAGLKLDHMRCESCGHEETWERDPSKQ